MQFKTPQENFWAGSFGDDYISRNKSEALLASNIHFFSKILSKTCLVNSFIELGANIGMNLLALRTLKPSSEFSAVEINAKAAQIMRSLGFIDVVEASILDFKPTAKSDFVLIKGVLIHLNPDALSAAYKALYESSSKYICIAEYYNPVPEAVAYRGHSDRLFKRDFAGEIMDLYNDLELIDYGFAYRRDPNFPQDDITWFLLRKT